MRDVMIRLVLAVTIINTASLAALLWLLLKRRLRHSELEIIMDSLDQTRGHVDTQGEHTALEHGALSKALEKANGRLQFLIAKDIAEELAIVRARQEVEKGEAI